MPEFCSCGAQLPPDAVFCHKCGKPQREIVEPEIVAPPPQPAVSTPDEKPVLPLTFRNPVAQRTAFLAAMAAVILNWVPILNIFLWLAAGFFAVFMYRKRTGQLLNLRGGLLMGWMTGILLFAMDAVLFTGMVVLFNIYGGSAAFQAQLRSIGDPKVMEALKLLQNGPEVVMVLIQLFFFVTLLSMIGGAIGAKLGRQ